MSDRVIELRSAIEHHRPADDLEAVHRQGVLRLLDESAADPLSRDHFLPGHITASAFIVHPASARLLLHHHRRLGRWLQMGGHVDAGEATLEAALREGREESGLTDLRPLRGEILDIDVHAIPAGRNEPDHLHFDVRYLFATAEPERIARQEAESHDLRWFDLGAAVLAMNEKGSARTVKKIAEILAADDFR